MFIVFITVKIPKELLFMILEFFMSYIANQYRGISKTRLLNVVVIVLLLVNLDIWCKITFPKWKQTLFVLPPFSVRLRRTWDHQAVYIQTLCLTAEKYWKLHCACAIQVGRKAHTILELEKKQWDLGQPFSGPQITFWEHGTWMCFWYIYLWWDLVPSELQGVVWEKVKFQLNFLKNLKLFNIINYFN